MECEQTGGGRAVAVWAGAVVDGDFHGIMVGGVVMDGTEKGPHTRNRYDGAGR